MAENLIDQAAVTLRAASNSSAGIGWESADDAIQGLRPAAMDGVLWS